MIERNHRRVWSAIPWGLLGMLVLSGAIERCAVRGNRAFLSLAAACWSHTGRYGVRAALGSEVLCFGDSMVKFGLLPRALERESGRSAYNLALLTGPAPASYFLLRRALDAGARPKAIVVDFAAGILAEGPEPKHRVYPWSDLLDLRETADLAWSSRAPTLLARLVLGHFLPSVRARYEIRARILADLRGEPDLRPGALDVVFRNRRDHRGAQVLPRAEFAPAASPPIGDRPESSWRCDPANEDYLRRFLALAARRRITVFWVFPPYSPGLQALNEYSGEDGRCADFARRVLRDFPDVVVIDARAAGYDRSVFFDQCHLDGDGAAALSAAVGRVVRSHLDGPGPVERWVSLPRLDPARVARGESSRPR